MSKRKPEQRTNDKVLLALRGLDPVRIENSATSGAPDINYLGGWVEDKTIDDWPKRALTIIKIPHYTPQQRGWQVRRRNAGGRVHVILEVVKANTLLVFDAADAAEGLGIYWTKADCLQFAHCKAQSSAELRDFFLNLDKVRYS